MTPRYLAEPKAWRVIAARLAKYEAWIERGYNGRRPEAAIAGAYLCNQVRYLGAHRIARETERRMVARVHRHMDDYLGYPDGIACWPEIPHARVDVRVRIRILAALFLALEAEDDS